MKQLKRFILILGTIIILSCNSDDNKSNSQGFLFDGSVNIFLKNSQGENLINTATFNSNNYKIYYEINGQKTEVNNPLMDAPKGFYINQESNPISMRLYLNVPPNENTTSTTTYIEWNNSDTDTLKTHFVKGDGYLVWAKLWLNDEVVWEEGSSTSNLGREITIIKD